jgi:hypothetical protein
VTIGARRLSVEPPPPAQTWTRHEIRGVARDAELLGDAEAAERAYAERYHAACRHYLDAIDPAVRATIVVANHSVD